MSQKPVIILLIEDDKAIQTVFKKLAADFFPEHLYEITHSICEAKELLKKKNYDLILCESIVPDGTGLELLNLNYASPVILLTSLDDEKLAIQSIKMGAYDYIVKDKSLNCFKKIPQILKNIETMKQIRDKNAIYSFILEQSVNMIMVTDLNEKIEYVNSKFTEITGYTLSETTGKKPSFLKSGQTPQETYRQLHEEINSGQEWKGEFINLKKNQQIYYESAHIFPIRDLEGSLIRFVKISEDLSEKKELESKIQESETLYRLIAENSTDMISKHTFEGLYTYVSPICYNLLGYKPSEMIGKNAYDFFHPDDIPFIQQSHNQIIHDPIISTFTYRIRKKDGSYTWFETTSRSVKYKNNHQIFEIIAISRDISIRKKNEQTLREMMEELSAVNEILEEKIKSTVIELREKDQMMIHQSKQAAMGEMIENIAHQWKQPLNQIGILIQSLLLNEKDGKISLEETKQVVADSMKIIQFMAQTIDDFRNFIKPNKTRSQFNLKELAEKTISIVSASLKSKRISINLKAEDSICITGFPNEYAQVLLNLFNNAKDVLIERKTPNPEIQIMIKQDPQTHQSILTFQDNAGGIAPELMNRMFEPYFTTKKEGTGLGLYMSKMIIEKSMNGKMTVKNNSQGAVFQILV